MVGGEIGVTVPPLRASGKVSFTLVGGVVRTTTLPSSTNAGAKVFGESTSTSPNDGTFVRYCEGSLVVLRLFVGLLVGGLAFVGIIVGLRVLCDLRIRRFLIGASIATGPRVCDAVGTAVFPDIRGDKENS